VRLGPDLLPIPEAIGCVDTADADIHHGDAPSALIPLGEVERLHIESKWSSATREALLRDPREVRRSSALRIVAG
jgi:hypothetical protein